jgi:hypothetical protein
MGYRLPHHIMKDLPGRNVFVFLLFALAVCIGTVAQAQNLNTIGVTLLQSVTTNLNGSGIRVAQPEAGYDQVTNWEVNPGGRPAGFITYISAAGSTTSFPNSLSSESSHADSVAGNFYGFTSGVATNIAHVDNYDANYFYDNIIFPPAPANTNDLVVNQSFTFGNVSTNIPTPTNYLSVSDQQQIDTKYDNYAASHNTLFVSAVNNGGSVSPPGTSYNCIGVGDSDGNSSIGPTLDNGRAKPDIVAPGGETSFSTPYVAGAAAVLIQAGLRGDGGSDTNSAADMRTVKALLLNGAVKPAGWTNISPSPLDAHYGAGVLNVFNSYEQLAGGKQGYIASVSVITNSPHLPTGAAGTVGGLSGWDFNTNMSSATTDSVKHYYFNVTNGLNNALFTAAATLVWNRHNNKTNINNLDLFLYDAISSNLVACSTSLVDNVKHLWLPQLPQGRYDLQVLKHGGTTVTTNETYALAWTFFSQSLNIAATETNVTLAWPVFPAGFFVEATADLTPAAVWTTNNLPVPVIANGSNYIFLNATNPAQFYQLSWPNL